MASIYIDYLLGMLSTMAVNSGIKDREGILRRLSGWYVYLSKRFRRISVLSRLICLVVVVIAATGAAFAEDSVGGKEVQAAALKTVTVQLNWKHQFEFAAFYAAIEKGYYREVGLDVHLREGGPNIDAVQEVLSGRSDFGVANSGLVPEFYRGKPVVALAALMQHSPVALLARRDHGVTNITDLVGKRIFCAPHVCDEIKAYLIASGIRLDQVVFVGSSAHKAVDRLKEVDATDVFLSNDGFWLWNREHEYVLFTPRSVGIDVYGDVLFTARNVLENKPDLVARFRQATIRGLNYALTHQADIVDLISLRYNAQQKSREHLLYEARYLYDLNRPDLVEPGYMSEGRWLHVRDTYAQLGALPSEFPLEGFIYDPNPAKRDLAKLSWYLAISLLAIGVICTIAVYIFYLNRRLSRSLASLSEANAKLLHSAYYDALTDVPNRVLFSERVDQTLRLANRNKTKMALMLLDLDFFKTINDGYGHAVGDAVLKEVATRIQQSLRNADSVGRIGGDEFVVMLSIVSGPDSAKQVAENICAAIEQPIFVGDLALSLTASVGVALYPDHGLDEIELTRHADMAMYYAKQHGRNKVHLFTVELAGIQRIA